jgi:hypothetical protein
MTAAVAALVLVFALAGQTLAWQSSSGYRNCGDYISALQSTWWGGLAHTPPGAGTTYLTYYGSATWVAYRSNGDYAGHWVSSADYLNFNGTYSYCTRIG